MRRISAILIAFGLCAGVPGDAVAQSVPERAAVAWRPTAPRQGSLVMVEVRPVAGDSVIAVRGELAGEELHFERGGDLFRALGAVPLGTEDSIAILVAIERVSGPSDTLAPSILVAPRQAPREHLRTTPEFLQPPDSLAAGIEAERQLVQRIKRRAHETPRLWRGPFTRPRRAAVTSQFGVTRLFNGAVLSRHLGVDFAGPRGAPVRAGNRGVIVFAGKLYYSGMSVFVDHGAGLVTGYFHLSRTIAAVGDTVRRGQVIGYVGATGRVTGPHLHWVATYGTVSIDPLDLLTVDLPLHPPSPLERR